MPTDNSRMVFFPSMLAKYSTVGFVWRMLRRLPYSLPFPIQADGSTNCALLVVCKCRAFGQCVCLAVSMLFFAPVFTLIPGFGRPGLSRPAASSPFQIPYKQPLGRVWSSSAAKGEGAFRKRKGGGSTYAEIRRGVHQASVHCYLKMAMVAVATPEMPMVAICWPRVTVEPAPTSSAEQ